MDVTVGRRRPMTRSRTTHSELRKMTDVSDMGR
jgi:hypothetical protein